MREEELKNKVARRFFSSFDCTQILGNIDFAVCHQLDEGQGDLFQIQSFLWAEAKANTSNITKTLAQLVLTIGKAKSFTKHLPPKYLGVFDHEKIAIVEYHLIQEIFSINDFNWNVAPSNSNTKEFKLIEEKLSPFLPSCYIFNFLKQHKELKKFIELNFKLKEGTSKIQIDKNNFIPIYNLWFDSVKPTIGINWEAATKAGLIDGDFYLADILSRENSSIQDKLQVLLTKSHYVLEKRLNEMGLFDSTTAHFKDGQKAHASFWLNYERPPLEQYWDYIVERRDLLVPQDIRERKGSFFTPKKWVALAQEYVARHLGENWQDEYIVWDLAAGTGNLLAGLARKYNVFASTLDKQDIDAMKQRIENGANLVQGNIFQFDFLNDPIDSPKIPQALRAILNDSGKRKKLLVFINPPYAEATTSATVTGTGSNKANVATDNKANRDYKPFIGKAANELFALFMAKIYKEIPDCKLALFSTLKFVQGSNFAQFKEFFKASYLAGFVVPADTFDNVTGTFPIGFTIWDTSIKENIGDLHCDAYDKNSSCFGEKVFFGNLPKSINQWMRSFFDYTSLIVGYMENPSPDFQNNKYLCITNNQGTRHVSYYPFNEKTFYAGSVYFSVRNSIAHSWLNDRDQFLWPNDGWKTDQEFQSDCLAFTLIHPQNRVSCYQGENHWIPYTEAEVGAKGRFTSHFMIDFINGKLGKPTGQQELFSSQEIGCKIIFSPEAQALIDAGRELWKLYHAHPAATEVNASFFDIRVFFQGKDKKGHIDRTGGSEEYKKAMVAIRSSSNTLAEKLSFKTYAYEFLK